MTTYIGSVPVPAGLEKYMPYAKFCLSVIGLVLSVAAAAASAGFALPLSVTVALPLAIQLVTALGVRQVPNETPAAPEASTVAPVAADGPAKRIVDMQAIFDMQRTMGAQTAAEIKKIEDDKK